MIPVGPNIAVTKVADRMGNWHVGRVGAEVGIRCRESDDFALWEPRKDKESDPYEDGQGNPAAGSHRRAGRGEHGGHVCRNPGKNAGAGLNPDRDH
jgi:hypothetical protein